MLSWRASETPSPPCFFLKTFFWSVVKENAWGKRRGSVEVGRGAGWGEGGVRVSGCRLRWRVPEIVRGGKPPPPQTNANVSFFAIHHLNFQEFVNNSFAEWKLWIKMCIHTLNNASLQTDIKSACLAEDIGNWFLQALDNVDWDLKFDRLPPFFNCDWRSNSFWSKSDLNKSYQGIVFQNNPSNIQPVDGFTSFWCLSIQHSPAS